MTESTPSKDVPVLANLPSDPRKSKAFHVPEYMNKPQVYPDLYGHYIRIWRAAAADLKKTDDFRRCVGLLEWTNLETGVTTGLMWYYSMFQIEAWKEYKYILYAHFPGNRPCNDTHDVYKDATAEINFQIKEKLRLKYEKKQRNLSRRPRPSGVFPS